MKKIVYVMMMCIAFVVMGLFSSLSETHAINLSFVPSDSTVNVGDILSIDIVISSLFADNLAAFDLNINYDDGILRFSSYVLGTELGDISAGDAFDWSSGDLGGGTINLAEVSLLSDFGSQPDSFVLASLVFSVLSPGITNLTFSDVVLSDEWGSPLIATLESGTVNSSAPIPEPATMFLIGIWLTCFIGLRHKYKKY